MAFLMNGDRWLVKWVFLMNDQVAFTQLHYRITNADGLMTGAGFATAIATVTATPIKALIANTVEFRGIIVQRVFPKPVSFPESSTTFAGAGTGGATILPRQASGIITTQTDFGGPRFRGRMYIPFPSTAYQDAASGKPTAGYVSALDGFRSVAIATLTDNTAPGTYDARPCLMDRVTGGTTDITASLSRQRWATQKRRGDYGQQNITPI